MTDITTLQLSEAIFSKLKNENITTLSESNITAFQNIEKGSNIFTDKSVTITPIILSIVNQLEKKNLKEHRSPQIMVLTESEECCKSFTDLMSTFISKEIVIIPCVSNSSLKTNKKKVKKASDIVIGDINRFGELINSDSVDLSNISIIVVHDAEKVLNNTENFDKILKKLSERENSNLQFIITSTEKNNTISTFVANKIPNCVEIIAEDSESSSEDEESTEDESDGRIPELIEVIKEEIILPSIRLNDTLLSRIKNATNFSKFESLAEQLINEEGDVQAISKALSLLSKAILGKPMKKLHTGSGSKLSGRNGFTAYLFRTNIEAHNKGYLFTGLKRYIGSDEVERIQKIRQTADRMGFVFDLPTELDELFQGKWKDGKFDRLELLDGEMPELMDEPRGGNKRANDSGEGATRGKMRRM